MVFRLYIRTDNEAFCSGDDNAGEGAHAQDAAPEIVRILRGIADRIEADGAAPYWFQTIRDVNGNDVGRYALKLDGAE